MAEQAKTRDDENHLFLRAHFRKRILRRTHAAIQKLTENA